MKNYLMTENEIDNRIAYCLHITNKSNCYCDTYVLRAAIALPLLIRIKDDVINGRIHPSIIKPNEPQKQTEPELEPDGKPF